MKKEIKADRRNRKPLTIWDRQYILQMRERGLGVREIAKKLSRNHSVVSRLLKNIPYSPYLSKLTPLELAYEMDRRARASRRKTRKRQRLKSSFLRSYVTEKLKLGWSPELIAGRLPLEHPELKTSHESIYNWIYREQRDLIKYLPIAGKNKNRKRGGSRRTRFKQPAAPKVSIEQRPEVVGSRKEFGHWEGDTIVSRQSTASLFNLIERGTRYMVLEKIDDLTASSGSKAMIKVLSEIPQRLRKTITLDNGPENSDHQRVDRELGTDTFFCHPYSACERGTVENRNRFARIFFPKKTDFSKVSIEQIKEVQDKHNHRPMKCLGFRTPHEVFWEVFCRSCDA